MSGTEELSNSIKSLDIGAYADDDAVVASFEEVLTQIRADALTNEGLREMFGIAPDGTEETMSAFDDDNSDRGDPGDESEWSEDEEGDVPPFPIDEIEQQPANHREGNAMPGSHGDAATGRKRKDSQADGSRNTTKRKRIRKTAAEQTPRQKVKEFWRKWENINKKSWSTAQQNRHVVKGLNFASHLSEDQKRIVNPIPDFSSRPRTTWRGKQPRMAVDEKGVPAVIVFPRWLRGKARKILYSLLITFGREVEVEIKKAADKNARDTRRSYTRRNEKGEVHGVFQLVTLWRAVGRWTGPAGPSRDILNKIRNFNATMRLLKRLRVMSKRLDHLFKLVDPAQHAVFSAAKTRLGALYPAYAALSAIDPTFFHGRSLIYNRETPLHTDDKDMKMAWTPVVTVGPYKSGTLRILDLEVEYRPGTLVFLRGGILPHQVNFAGGQRVAVAHFMHRDILASADVHILPLSALAFP